MKKKPENTEPDNTIQFPTPGSEDATVEDTVAADLEEEEPEEEIPMNPLNIPEHLHDLENVPPMKGKWEATLGESVDYNLLYASRMANGLASNSIPLATKIDDLDDEQLELVKQLSGIQHMIVQDRIATYAAAAMLYRYYCESVGNVAFNGDPLPTWDEFAADTSKERQVRAWIAVGEVSMHLQYGNFRRGVSAGQRMFVEKLTGGGEF